MTQQTAARSPQPAPQSAARSRDARAPLRWLWIALIVLPPLLLSLLIDMYGVNIPYWDEWDDSVILHMKYLDHDLHLADFFQNTNEHRPAIPRMIGLAIEIATHGNRRAEMF